MIKSKYLRRSPRKYLADVKVASTWINGTSEAEEVPTFRNAFLLLFGAFLWVPQRIVWNAPFIWMKITRRNGRVILPNLMVGASPVKNDLEYYGRGLEGTYMSIGTVETPLYGQFVERLRKDANSSHD